MIKHSLTENKVRMKKFSLPPLLACAVYFLPLQPLFAQSISGRVEAGVGVPVKKLIVYLQAGDSVELNKQPQTHPVSQKDTRFNPPLSIITAGDSVQWLNDETKEIDHNIFSLSELSRFDLGLGAKGSKLEQTFKKTGELNYYCSVHKNMEGKIVVLPNRYYQLLEQPGDFTLDGLPEGHWVLNAIVFNRRYKAEPIKLTVGKKPLQNLTLKIVKR
jgi:plastocyanin